jgi:hypothetical protein
VTRGRNVQAFKACMDLDPIRTPPALACFRANGQSEDAPITH